MNASVGLKSLGDLREIELKRFLEALETGQKNLFQQKSQKMSPEKFYHYVSFLELNKLLLFQLAEEISENLLSMRESDRDRSKWEIYVSGLRFIGRFFRKGYVSNVIFPLLEMEQIVVYINSLVEESLNVLNNIQKVGSLVEIYAANYSWAAEQTEAIKKKERRLCLRYASLKTWELEEEFFEFTDCLQKAILGSIEIFIEGPIKLYVMLGRERFLLILRALTAERLSEMKEMDKYLSDALNILITLSSLIEKSDLLNALRELLPESLSQHVKIWKEEQESIRGELPTRELRRLFIERFENGTLFIKK